ncbi:hypothetical protein ABZ912_20160 [Nonomuraea angiospora]|uniref:hypothetical protein n=1 Tax=Nonomuraea angiospora TaxID=46172 RepID=UPI0033FAD5A7
MSIRHIARTIIHIVVAVALDLLEVAAYFGAIALVTALLGLVLPFTAAFVVALLGVSVCFGYRKARQIERARMRGENR